MARSGTAFGPSSKAPGVKPARHARPGAASAAFPRARRRRRGRARPIVILGGPGAEVLRTRSGPVPSVTDAIRGLIADLTATMRRARGVGLAAPQIGVPLRVLVADAGGGPIALVNPRLRRRWGVQVGPEGCLSIPGAVYQIRRALGVVVEARSANGRRALVRATGFLARILQHEIDHLNGVLLPDRLPARRRARGPRHARARLAPAKARTVFRGGA